MDCFNYLTIYLLRHWIYLYYAPSTCCSAQTFRHPTEHLTPHPPISSGSSDHCPVNLTWSHILFVLLWLTDCTYLDIVKFTCGASCSISFSFYWIVFCMYSPRFICSFMMREHLAASTSRILWIKQPHTRLHTRFYNFCFPVVAGECAGGK